MTTRRSQRRSNNTTSNTTTNRRKYQNADNSKKQDNKKTDKSNKKKMTPKRFGWIVLNVIFVLFLVGTLAGGAVGVYVLGSALSDLPELNLDTIKSPQRTMVYDKDGNPVEYLSEDEYKAVKYEDIPDVVIDAFVAVEDARFFSHRGYDPKRMVGAVIGNFTSGDIVSGASTITQQLIQNTVIVERLYQDPTYTNSIKRKVQEIILAAELETKMSKEEIMESYLNTISFGRYSGIGTAAKRYFNKDISEITLAEAVILAGIPQNPSENNPYENIESANVRRNTVLDLMVRHGFISNEEADAARSIPISDLLAKDASEFLNTYYAYFTGVRQELATIPELEGITDYNSGYKIYTNLDVDMQKYANDLLDNAEDLSYFPEDDPDYNAAFAVVQTTTGKVPAIGGGRNINYTNEGTGGFNIGVNGGIEPGSSIKPVIDYALAVDQNHWSTAEEQKDQATTYTGGGSIYNYNQGGYSGSVTLKYAIAQSLNTTALQAYQSVGSEKITEYMKTLNFRYFDSYDAVEPNALGGSMQISPLELAGAYTVFGNDGKFIQPYFITKITDVNDNVIYEHQDNAQQVISPEAAYIMTKTLEYTAQTGTAARGNIGGMAVAAKTGTSSYSPEEREEFGISLYDEKDHWYVGYTPEYSLAAWSGYTKPYEAAANGKFGKNEYKYVSADIFQKFLTKYGTYGTSFTAPNGVVSATVMAGVFPAQVPPSGYNGETSTDYFFSDRKPVDIGSYNISIPAVNASLNESSQTVNWSAPSPAYGEAPDSVKKAFGNIVYDVYVIDKSGKSTQVANGVSNTSFNYSAYKSYSSVEVVARFSNYSISSKATRVNLPVVQEETTEN